jgi:acetyl-CoA acetyltransferase
MREVVVLGIGMSQFGKQPEKGIRELGEEALYNALIDAEIDKKKIQIAFCGYVLGSLNGQEVCPGQIVLRQLGIGEIPVLRVENGCASASFAFKEAWRAVASGEYDVAVGMGIEKMTGLGKGAILKAMGGGSDFELEGNLGLTFPGVFAMIARRHMHEYGTTMKQLAMVAVKNRKNGSLNQKSQFREVVTIEDIENATMIAHPLTLNHCCPFSDGCAVAILTTKEIARKYTTEPIYIASSVQKSGTYTDSLDITRFEPTIKASAEAYKLAGIGPEDINLAEVHDCFTIAEIIHYEDLGFCKKGEGGMLIENGATQIGGRIPVSTSGGLLSKGHPLGATGVAQIVEIVEQLRGKSGPRQVSNAKVGLAHCLGGFIHGDVCSCSVTILKK